MTGEIVVDWATIERCGRNHRRERERERIGRRWEWFRDRNSTFPTNTKHAINRHNKNQSNPHTEIDRLLIPLNRKTEDREGTHTWSRFDSAEKVWITREISVDWSTIERCGQNHRRERENRETMRIILRPKLDFPLPPSVYLSHDATCSLRTSSKTSYLTHVSIFFP